VSNGTGEGGNMENTEIKLKKKTLSSLLLVNFANFIRVLVSSFFVGILCFGAF